jgi:hypothetical protein
MALSSSAQEFDDSTTRGTTRGTVEFNLGAHLATCGRKHEMFLISNGLSLIENEDSLSYNHTFCIPLEDVSHILRTDI